MRLGEIMGGHDSKIGPRSEGMVFWTATLCLAAALAPWRIYALTADVSWLITVCEKILDGEKLYVDVLETNPPSAVLLYMPGVLLARATGLAPEAATYLVACVYVFIALVITDRILPRCVDNAAPSRWVVLLPATLVLLLLPSDAFAQREYFAAAFALPIVAAFIRHAQTGHWPLLGDRAVAAILAGLTIAIKPPLLALPGLFVAVYYTWQTKSWKPLYSSGLIAAGLLGVSFTLVALSIFPDYLGEIGTLMREAYIPVRSALLSFLEEKACLAALSLMALSLLLSWRRQPVPAESLSLVVALGFLAAYVLQGKYFPYHAIPAILFAFIAAIISVHHRLRTLRLRSSKAWIPSLGIYALAFAGVIVLLIAAFSEGRPTMSNVAWAKNILRPTALAISPDVATSFPLARRIGARWVDRNHSQWVARYTRLALQSSNLTDAQKAQFTRHYIADLKWLLHRISEAKPEIIIQDVAPGYLWLLRELAAMDPHFLDAYEPIAEESGIRVLRRKR